MTIKGIEKYLNDYDIVKIPHQKPHLVYHGELFKFSMDNLLFKRYKRVMLVLSCLYLLFWCLVSLSDPTSLRGQVELYVAIPYVALIFPIIIMIGHTIHFQKLGQVIERIDHDKCVESLSNCTVFTGVFSGAAAVGQVVYIVLHCLYGFGEIMCISCFLTVSILSRLSYRIQKLYPCIRVVKMSTFREEQNDLY